MDLVSVESSAIVAIGYADGVLFVRFSDSPKVYSYPRVSGQVFKDFLQAPSKGKFFNEHIRDVYLPLN